MAASAAGAAAALASRQLLRAPGGGRPLVAAAAAAAVAGLPRRGGTLPSARGTRGLADASPAAPVPSGAAAPPPSGAISGDLKAGTTSSGMPVAAAGAAAAPLTPTELSALSGVPVEHAGRRLRIFQQPRPATQQGRGSKTRVWMAAWEKLGDVDRWTNPLMVRMGGGGGGGGWGGFGGECCGDGRLAPHLCVSLQRMLAAATAVSTDAGVNSFFFVQLPGVWALLLTVIVAFFLVSRSSRVSSRPRTRDPPPPPSYPQGWTSTADPLSQLSVRFPSREAAEAYAVRNGYTYVVDAAPEAAENVRSFSAYGKSMVHQWRHDDIPVYAADAEDGPGAGR